MVAKTLVVIRVKNGVRGPICRSLRVLASRHDKLFSFVSDKALAWPVDKA